MTHETILITGAAGALGSALAAACAESGFNIVLLDSDRRGLDEAYDHITVGGFTGAALYPMDLAKVGPEHIDELVSTIESEFGGLDGVVHCAARFEGLTPLDQVPPQEWLLHMQVNLNAPWLLSVACLPLLRKSQRGRVYFILENLERVRRAYWGPYGVAKHALAAMVDQFATEQRSSGIQILGIDPGAMRSALRSRAYHAEDPSAQPDPALAAGRIMSYLSGQVESEAAFIELFPG